MAQNKQFNWDALKALQQCDKMVFCPQRFNFTVCSVRHFFKDSLSGRPQEKKIIFIKSQNFCKLKSKSHK